jgi:hypothetical protein
MPGAGDANIEKSALLFDGSLSLGAFVGKEAILSTDKPDLGIL